MRDHASLARKGPHSRKYAGVPLNHVQLLLGHTDPRTTQGYIKGFTPMKLLRELARKVERVRGKGGGGE